MINKPINFFSFFLLKKSQLDNTILKTYSLKSQIYNNKNQITNITKDILFINDLAIKDNKTLFDILDINVFLERQQKQKDYFKDIEKYKKDIETLNYISQNLNTEKNHYLSKSYNSKINLLKQYHKVFIGYFKDTNIYNVVDKRQNIFKNTDYINFAYRLYLTHKITIKEYRNFKRHNIISNNLKAHLHFKLNQNLKVSHKKHKINKSKYQSKEYIYIAKFNRLIRFKYYATKDTQQSETDKPFYNDFETNLNQKFTTKFIHTEIDKKRKYEIGQKNLYSYSII